MAAVSVTFDGTRLNAADATTGFTAEAATPTAETDFFYQGTACISAAVKTTETGFYYTAASTNFSSPARTWLAKVIITNKDALDGIGLALRIGSATTAYYQYNVFTAATYPIIGGWQVVPIDPNVSAHRTSTTGSPNLAAVIYMAVRADCNAISKAPNLGMDAMDYIPSAKGLTLVGGDGADADGTFNSFVSFDEGTVANRYGVVQTRNGIIYCNAVLTIGSATATVFTDSNGVVVFPDARINTSGCGLAFNLGSASSVITISNYVFNGRGAAGSGYDSRPDYAVTNTSGTLAISGTAFNVFRAITLNSKCTLTSCSFLNGLSITQSSAVITGCNFSGATTATGVAYVTSNAPASITNCAFTFSAGHAIEITTPGTYTFSGNTFSGYGADGTNSAAIYNNSGGAVTLNIAGGGGTPTVRNGAGASTTVNAGAVTIAITAVNSTGTPVQNARVLITAANGTGPFPFDVTVTIANSGTTATVTHTTHGMATNDYVQIKGASHRANNGVFQITVTGANTYTYTMPSAPGSNPTGTIKATFAALYGLTDSSGLLSTSRVYASSQPIIGKARKSSTAPFYKTSAIVGTVSNTAGFSTTIVLIEDQ